MTRKEMLEKARAIRERDQFGAMTPEELKALPGTEQSFVLPTAGREVTVYALQPDAPLPHPCGLIINYHGGGFLKGRSSRDRRYCAFLAERLGCLVWDVDYCLAPENPFPAALEESYGVAAYAFSHASELGVDPTRIALAGHSAGGNLVCALMLKDADVGALRPCCLLMEYFPADQSRDPETKLTEAMRADPWWVRRAQTEREYARFYAEGDQLRNPLCSPLLAAEGAFTHAHFPPSLILSADTDLLRKEVEEMAARLIAEGVETTACRCHGAIHGFTVNRTEGWEPALELHCKFFGHHL